MNRKIKVSALAGCAIMFGVIALFSWILGVAFAAYGICLRTVLAWAFSAPIEFLLCGYVARAWRARYRVDIRGTDEDE